MRQILCDRCGGIIDPEQTGDEEITFVGVAIWSKDDAHWKEYHRRCARQETVATVWQRHGLVPL